MYQTIELISDIRCNDCRKEFLDLGTADAIMFKGRVMYYEHEYCNSEGSNRADTDVETYIVEIIQQ